MGVTPSLISNNDYSKKHLQGHATQVMHLDDNMSRTLCCFRGHSGSITSSPTSSTDQSRNTTFTVSHNTSHALRSRTQITKTYHEPCAVGVMPSLESNNARRSGGGVRNN